MQEDIRRQTMNFLNKIKKNLVIVLLKKWDTKELELKRVKENFKYLFIVILKLAIYDPAHEAKSF